MKEFNYFNHFGVMIDNSRNAVMQPESVKKMIDILEKLGYNTLMLYTEDTYEVDGHPYFGYLRGRYSKSELKDLDLYAKEHHVELIPCIQTLAHLNGLMRWSQYEKISDSFGILCAGEEKVYELIDSMFSTLAECFTSRIVNVGMDEAESIGLGRYLEKHGYCNRFEILISHLTRVLRIAEKYGFELCMWSDMFFKLLNNSNYKGNTGVIEEIKRRIPDYTQLIYWDYYSTEKQHYDDMMAAHNSIIENVWFAGGLWTWTGFAPHNKFSIQATKAALESCVDHRVKNVILTLWGDDGGECSRFSVLPSLFYASCLAKGINNESDIKRSFEEVFEIPFDSFMLLDLPGTANDFEGIRNPDKYMLYNDCFLGQTDSTVRPEDANSYAHCAERLKPLIHCKEWGWLFETMHALCEVHAVKFDIGLKTRVAYQSKDITGLNKIVADYETLIEKLENFYTAYERHWMIENKPHGFDVQDVRIGGLIWRVKHCKHRLEDYIHGNIPMIEDLEEEILDVLENGSHFSKEPICFNNWKYNFTVNIL